MVHGLNVSGYFFYIDNVPALMVFPVYKCYIVRSLDLHTPHYCLAVRVAGNALFKMHKMQTCMLIAQMNIMGLKAKEVLMAAYIISHCDFCTAA